MADKIDKLPGRAIISAAYLLTNERPRLARSLMVKIK
jgi:hypothetical protein